jgi:hypothetical protein
MRPFTFYTLLLIHIWWAPGLGASKGDLKSAQTIEEKTSPMVAPLVSGACETQDECGDNQKCTTLFHRTGDNLKKTCYHQCAQAQTPCQTSDGGVGQCMQWAHAGLLCVGRAAQHQACGDMVNAMCEKDLLCLEHPGMMQGVCGRVCDPDAHATCQQPELFGTPFCGCHHDEVCSVSPIAISVKGGKAKDGVCTQTQLVGAACGGFNEQSNFQLCPEGQVCAYAKDRPKALCWSELALMDDQGRQLTTLTLEKGGHFTVGQKQRPERELIQDFDRQCGCTESLKPCGNIAQLLGFVWFGGCCVPEGCTP